MEVAMMRGGNFAATGWIMVATMIVVVGGFWFVVASLVGNLFGARRNPEPRSEPMHALELRLARGEITTEEYEERRRFLVDGH